MWRGANALFGVLLLAALWVVIQNIDAERRFATLLTHAAPGWLLVAVGYQVSTYVCAAGVSVDGIVCITQSYLPTLI